MDTHEDVTDVEDPVCAAYRRVARVMREEAARLAECAPAAAGRFTAASDQLLDAADGPPGWRP